jgi:L-asparaginase
MSDRTPKLVPDGGAAADATKAGNAQPRFSRSVEDARPRKRIVVVGTGGSIATWARSAFDLVDYGRYGEVLPIDVLLHRLPEVAEIADLVPVDFSAVHSEAVGPDEWCAFARALENLSLDSSIDGIVMVHGTSSLEETAWFLDLVLRLDIPVVLVGAQRPPNGLGTDAGANLADAVRAASDPRVAELGVVAVFQGEIHAARDVAKASTYRLNAFDSGELGPLGFVDPNGDVVLYRVPYRRPDAFPLSAISTLPRVDIVAAYAGADGVAIAAAVRAGAQGIVVAGMAPGICASGQLEALNRARAQGVCVVFSTHNGRGRVVRSAFLTENGFSAADNLTPEKARILLMLCLGAGEDEDGIRDRFRLS